MSTERQTNNPYRQPARLSEVLALLQVLALSKNAVRGEGGLRGTLGAEPVSASSWTELAAEHPELFRVSGGREPSASLIARFALSPMNDKGTRAVLDEAFLGRLTAMAIELHDREAAREEQQKREERQREEQIAADVRLSEARLADAQERRREREAEYGARLVEERKLRETTRVASIAAATAVGIAAAAVLAKVIFGF